MHYRLAILIDYVNKSSCVFNYVDYLNFSQSIYKIYEDHDGSMCVELTHHKPALFDVMVEVNETAQDAISKHT